jgi:3-hydroxyisobutyrate dehydrogenase-like beta-hydroxyacid dehydrogenase
LLPLRLQLRRRLDSVQRVMQASEQLETRIAELDEHRLQVEQQLAALQTLARSVASTPLSAGAAGAPLIDTSTSAVELVQELVVLAHHKGLGFLEAPVTNAVDMAALGRLSIFVGG